MAFKIRSTADKERTIILAEARKQSEILRGEGDEEATRIFAKAFAALRPGGLIVDADCMLAADPALRARHHDLWLRHLAAVHGLAGARRFLRAWADEDTYFPLELETTLLREAGFIVDVVWRRDGFAVVAATRPRRQTITR